MQLLVEIPTTQSQTANTYSPAPSLLTGPGGHVATGGTNIWLVSENPLKNMVQSAPPFTCAEASCLSELFETSNHDHKVASNIEGILTDS